MEFRESIFTVFYEHISAFVHGVQGGNPPPFIFMLNISRDLRSPYVYTHMYTHIYDYTKENGSNRIKTEYLYNNDRNVDAVYHIPQLVLSTHSTP